MATNEILPFAQGSGANVQSQAAYTAEPLRSSGNVAGIARSAVNNKALRQASVIAAGIAQFMADRQANNITDSATPANISAWMELAVQSLSSTDFLNTVRIDVASASTINLTASAPNTRHINITGTTTINRFTVDAGECYFVRFDGALTLTNSVSLVTQSGANITTTAGDTCIIRATAASVVEVLAYTVASVTGTGRRVFSVSPALTGTPTAPTAASGTNTTQIATTAFVAAVKAALDATDALKAPLESPTFTGAPAAPTPAQFGNKTSLATTGFVQRALGNYQGAVVITASGALSVADAGKVHLFSGVESSLNLTLPALSGLPVGAAYHFHNNSGYNRTLTGSGSDLISSGQVTVTNTYVIPPGCSATLTKVSTEGWVVSAGTSSLYQAEIFASFLSANGYQKLPSGLIIQWGSLSVNTDANGAVVFPLAFPTVFLNAHATAVRSIASNSYGAFVNSTSTTGLSILNDGGTTKVYWIAIGF